MSNASMTVTRLSRQIMGGFNFGAENLDGYGISNIVVAVTYSICFYAACIFLWLYRRHPVVKMRNVPLLLLSLLVLHVFLFMVFMVYTLNGAFPCQVEFWCMNIYLPIGIGLFQAQNQQLLIVSRQQSRLIVTNEQYKPLLPKTTRGIGGPRYWLFRLKRWWRGINEESKYQGFIFIGFVVQFIVSFVVYNISRKFNHYGVVSKHVSPALCRRGWEWAPSIIWQFLWNYGFGPYLVWKIHLIRDIYHWRLQTIIAIIAGLPGTPIWLASVYTTSFASVNKYWIPAMWFIPGLMTMEIVTLGFPIYQILKHKRNTRETARALAEFDQKRLGSVDAARASSSVKTRSTTSKGGKMYSMESLDEALATNYDGLQVYASCMEFNGENIIFLTKVLSFKKACQRAFHETCKSTSEFRKARIAMFRIALGMFISLVHSGTAPYPINIESSIYNRLDAIFGPATALVAIPKLNRTFSTSTSNSSNLTPWDNQSAASDREDPGASGDENSFAMHTMGSGGLSTPSTYNIQGNESREHIVGIDAADVERIAEGTAVDPLAGVRIPAEFDENVFEAAFKSIRYMVWTETWQRYQAWKRGSGNSGLAKGV